MLIKALWGWALWPMTIIPTLGRQRQEDGEFEASLGYIANLGYTMSRKPKKENLGK
jgi:hypothetical protein